MSAVATAISEATATALTNLGLSYASTNFTIGRRKNPSLPQGKDPPQLVVSISDRRKYRDITATLRLCTYTMAVTVVTGGGAQLGEDDALQLVHEQIRNAVAQKGTFSGVSQFNAIDAGGEAPFDVTALTRAMLNYGIQVFTVETLEARS